MTRKLIPQLFSILLITGFAVPSIASTIADCRQQIGNYLDRQHGSLLQNVDGPHPETIPDALELVGRADNRANKKAAQDLIKTQRYITHFVNAEVRSTLDSDVVRKIEYVVFQNDDRDCAVHKMIEIKRSLERQSKSGLEGKAPAPGSASSNARK